MERHPIICRAKQTKAVVVSCCHVNALEEFLYKKIQSPINPIKTKLFCSPLSAFKIYCLHRIVSICGVRYVRGKTNMRGKILRTQLNNQGIFILCDLKF